MFNEQLFFIKEYCDNPYKISNSALGRRADSTYLTRTRTASDRQRWVFSGWIKTSELVSGNPDNEDPIFSAYSDASHSTSIGIQLFEGQKRFVVKSVDGTIVQFAGAFPPLGDVSAWYHLMVRYDSTQAVEADRLTIWINGHIVPLIALTGYPIYPPLNAQSYINSTVPHYVNRRINIGGTTLYSGLYLADMQLIDGVGAGFFGKFNRFGQWVPVEYTDTYGTNGFHLNFSIGNDLGKDSSPNHNDFTSYVYIANDQTLDSPTNNHAILSDYKKVIPLTDYLPPSTATTITKGGLNYSTTADSIVFSTFSVREGKYYCEMKVPAVAGDLSIGVGSGDYLSDITSLWASGTYSGPIQSGDTFRANDVVMMSFDCDTKALRWGKNGTWFNNGIPRIFYKGDRYAVALYTYGLTAPVNNIEINFGQRPFLYPQAGYQPMSTVGIHSDPPIAVPNKHFGVATYTGTGTAAGNYFTCGPFVPELMWVKSRSANHSHRVVDRVRGYGKALRTDTTQEEVNEPEGITPPLAFPTEQVTVGNNPAYNELNQTYVAYGWNRSPQAGFDILNPTVTPQVPLQVPHNLGKVPAFGIIKLRESVSPWIVYHRDMTSNPENYTLQLNLSNVMTTSDAWDNTPLTDEYVTVRVGGTGGTGSPIIYLWSEIDQYSKFGFYIGNGDVKGPYINLRFKPAFVMIKSVNEVGNWYMTDHKRSGTNLSNNVLLANTDEVEAAYERIDLYSNGFHVSPTAGQMAGVNTAAQRYVYVAFAQHPFSNKCDVAETGRAID